MMSCLQELIWEVYYKTIIGAIAATWAIYTLFPDENDFHYVPKRVRRQKSWDLEKFLEWVKSTIEKGCDRMLSWKILRTHRKQKHKYKRKRNFRCVQNYKMRKICNHDQRVLLPATNIPQSSHWKMPVSLHLDANAYDIGVDTLSTSTMTNSISDFISPVTDCSYNIRQAKGTVNTTKKGTVRWRILDDEGYGHNIIIQDVIYCPTLPFRVLSPQQWSRQQKNLRRGKVKYEQDDEIGILTWTSKSKQTATKTIRMSAKSGVPIMQSAPGYSNYMTCKEINKYRNDDKMLMTATTKEGANVLNYVTEDEISDAEPETEDDTEDEATDIHESRQDPIDVTFDHHEVELERMRPTDFETKINNDKLELLAWHYRLGHIPFSSLKTMANEGIIPRKLRDTPVPKCPGCLYAKATKRPWRTKAAPSKVETFPIVAPGDCISVDQLESPTPGLIAHLKGSPTKARYRAATVFVDHFSRYSYVHLQKSTNATETLEAKKAFEDLARARGIRVKHYHADNGRFAETAWLADIARSAQSISFCGVNAHFQNGVAERRIRTLQELARAQLLHAKSKWPLAISSALWPYAIRVANQAHNSATHKGHKESPAQKFSGSTEKTVIHHNHHFGVPVYVLDKRLQQGKQIPKWEERARIGIYLGLSTKHARSVALVLNPRTGLVSPQFHLRFDDLFETVRGTRDKSHATWKSKCGFEDQVVEKQTVKHAREKPKLASTNTSDVHYRNNYADTIPTNQIDHGPEIPVADLDDPPDTSANTNDTTTEEPRESTQIEEESVEHDEVKHVQNTSNLRRSQRQRKMTTKMKESIEQQRMNLAAVTEHQESPEESLTDWMNPLILLAKATSNKDVMYYHEAMKQKDRAQFIKAMEQEVHTHTKRGHWELVRIEEVPEEETIKASVWAMRRKRRIKTKEVYKWKSRINFHGGQQIFGIDFWETFAPVVTWASIRLVLILSIVHGWATRQVDFVLAYPQADIEKDTYMAIPEGFVVTADLGETYVLKLLKNIYGQKQAGRVWNQYLHDKLINDHGFEQSKADDCVYFRGKTTFMVYVDDGIFAGPDLQEILNLIKEMQESFEMTDEGDLSDYLGVNIEKKDDGTIHLTQPHLIDQILDDVNFQDATKPKTTPAQEGSKLFKDEDTEEHCAHWKYNSVIGKLNFLEKSSRPDIATATHACARFMSCPRTTHTEAVIRICRYLKGTKDKGIILRPNDELCFKLYTDADFCGLWHPERAKDDPSTAKSRAGYVLLFAGCPIIWGSTLIKEITLSVLEAEYISLSNGCRHTIPCIWLLQDMIKWTGIKFIETPEVYCSVFVDNKGAIELAKVPKMRPRTKYINTHYHWFRRHVRDGLFNVSHVDAENQWSDMLTKHLPLRLFSRFRQCVLGW